MSEALRRALGIAVSARVPVLLWGPPGVGKTSAVKQLAEAAGLPCEIVIASIREPSDFSGLPVVSADGRSVHLAPPVWATRLHDAGRGVLFLDEVSTAAPAVQAALLRIVLERVVGELPLPEAVAVIAAANPPEEAADGWDLAPPLANRFCHLNWALDVDGWRHGVLAGFPDISVDPVEPAELARHARAALGEIGAFMAHRPALLHQMPKDERQAGRAWPSPRTWTTAAQLLAAAQISGAPADAVHLFRGRRGRQRSGRRVPGLARRPRPPRSPARSTPSAPWPHRGWGPSRWTSSSVCSSIPTRSGPGPSPSSPASCSMRPAMWCATMPDAPDSSASAPSSTVAGTGPPTPS